MPSRRYLIFLVCLCVCTAAIGTVVLFQNRGVARSDRDFGWADIPTFSMSGDLRAYWNVGDGSKGEAAKHAYARGFASVTLLGTYSDYPGNQRENISVAAAGNLNNPWRMPPFFERIVKRNIDNAPPRALYVHDIELPFEENTSAAWNDDAIRVVSGATSRQDFDVAYFRKWAEWFWLPLGWTKERYPDARVGLYGAQPFHRDYYGVAGKNAAQIDGTHQSDWKLWQYIDPYVDFYIASVYIFYDKPDSVFYLAANVEENYRRTRFLGNKPVYAYEWMRFHDSNWFAHGRELTPYLIEAMAIVPYFSGAKGVVLWGWEPQVKVGSQQPYEQLPLFVRSLKRVSMLSDKISRGRLLDDMPAWQAWSAHAPLIRRIMLNENECVIMAVDPWQEDGKKKFQAVQCGQLAGQIVMDGRHTALAILNWQGLHDY